MASVSRKLKDEILNNQLQKCADCAKELTLKTTHFDHILPRWEGGLDNKENLQALCPNCHSIKTHTENKKKHLKKQLEKKGSSIKGHQDGPFTKLWLKGGDEVHNNLQGFYFRNEVLDYYINKPNEFTIKKGIMSFLSDKQGRVGLKFSGGPGLINNEVSAILKDLAELPKFHQKHWHKHLVNFGWNLLD